MSFSYTFKDKVCEIKCGGILFEVTGKDKRKWRMFRESMNSGDDAVYREERKDKTTHIILRKDKIIFRNTNDCEDGVVVDVTANLEGILPLVSEMIKDILEK